VRGIDIIVIEGYDGPQRRTEGDSALARNWIDCFGGLLATGAVLLEDREADVRLHLDMAIDPAEPKKEGPGKAPARCCRAGRATTRRFARAP
jgi:hypothetical protein